MTPSVWRMAELLKIPEEIVLEFQMVFVLGVLLMEVVSMF
jgi:hypothetical protein